MTKKMLLTVVGVSVLSGGLVVATSAFAQTNPQSTVPSLAQEIATKFNLNPSDVQTVFTQHRQEMQSKMESNYETYLTNLVSTGKITQEQEQLILAEHKQLQSQMQNDFKNFKTMTPAERQAQMQSLKQEVQDWAKQNNISVQYLRPFGTKKFIIRMRRPTATPTPS